MSDLLFISGGEITLFIVLGVIAVLIAFLLVLVPVRLWFQALVSGAYVSMVRLAAMKLRKVDVKKLVYAYIKGKKAGLNFSIDEMETHYLASGDVDKVVDALIAAHSANIALPIDVAKGIDLAGRDILEAIRYSVDPHIIDIPTICAIACDGVELKVSARATVRVNISRLIGGAGEETIIARIGEGDLPSDFILGEHVRLGSSSVILSRTFKGIVGVDANAHPINLGEEVLKVRKRIGEINAWTKDEFLENRKKII